MRFSLDRLSFWLPRLLSIVFALFLSLFAFDVFEEGLSLDQVLLAFTLHLFPAIAVVTILLLAWRWEWVGVVLYTAAAALYSNLVLPGHPSWAAVIAGPLLLLALLFLFSWLSKQRVRVTF